MADVKIAIKRVELPKVSAGTVDATETGFGTVKAAIVIVGYSSPLSGGHSTSHQWFSIGYWDGTDQACVYAGSDNLQATSACNRGHYASGYIVGILASGTLIANYTISNITDGVRFTMDTSGTGAERYAIVIMFGGDDVSANVGFNATQDTLGSATTINGVGFRPDIIFWATEGYNTAAVVSAPQNIMSLGVTRYQNGIQNRAICWFDYDAQATMSNGTAFVDAHCVAQYFADVFYWKVLSRYIADGTIEMYTDGGGTDGDYVMWMALKLGGYNARLVDFDTLTSTGTQIISGLGFEPSHVITFVGKATAYDNHTGDICVSIGASDGTNEYSENEHSQDNVTTSNAGSKASTNLIDLVNPSNSGVLVQANLDHFYNDGFVLDYTTVAGSAYKGFAIAFQTTDSERAIGAVGHKFLTLELT